MSLVPNLRIPKPRKIATYDLEWIPKTYELRLAGFYDGTRYRAFANVEALLNCILTREYRGWSIYAHAGGLADLTFLLEKLATREDYRVTASFSGSSAIIVKIQRGKDVWTLYDSFWLLRDKLAHLAAFTGIAKGRDAWKCPGYPACGHVGRACLSAPKCGCAEGPEPMCMFWAPLPILKAYNERDCRILHAAVTGFQGMLLEIGSELRATVASTALTLFRTKYLSQKIPTSAAKNDMLRASYVASRVEVIKPALGSVGADETARYYDVNSSFPFAMLQPAPGAYIGSSRHLPDAPPGEGNLYFADAEVEVPKMFLPPLGARGRDGRIYFPTGRWRGLFPRADIELLQEHGGRVRKVHEVWSYEPWTDLALYASDLYARRAVAKNEGKDFLALLLKYLLNSAYGKFGEHREKEEMILHPWGEGCPHGGEHDAEDPETGETVASCVTPLFPGCILVKAEKNVPHEHVAVASHITAVARGTLYRFMAQCDDDLYYCDTDSIVTKRELPTSSKLGGLKLEYEITGARFVQPKLYDLRKRDSDGNEVREIRSKGFSRLDAEQFDALVAGREVEVTRMFRVKEAARAGRFGARDKNFGKRIRIGANRPKRAPDGDNRTRPWTVKEIHKRWEPKKTT